MGLLVEWYYDEVLLVEYIHVSCPLLNPFPWRFWAAVSFIFVGFVRVVNLLWKNVLKMCVLSQLMLFFSQRRWKSIIISLWWCSGHRYQLADMWKGFDSRRVRVFSLFDHRRIDRIHWEIAGASPAGCMPWRPLLVIEELVDIAVELWLPSLLPDGCLEPAQGLIWFSFAPPMWSSAAPSPSSPASARWYPLSGWPVAWPPVPQSQCRRAQGLQVGMGG